MDQITGKCILCSECMIFTLLVSSALCHSSSDAFRPQLVLIEDNDRLLKTAYVRPLSLG